ncbi:hypothetical protein Glove_116g55 [Diversispora epigaea]|uniref:Cytochrome c oxidase copper chaperone n=1 Tax=Diversispora epigaea TaxID=1348612 RepID=A0A397J4L4_9GLOM|nr:hypothetical protein Glove_116g55 [Diversispora epigaea]
MSVTTVSEDSDLIKLNNNNNSTNSTNSSTTNDKPKPCCVCPDTKKERDECIFKYGDEVKCKDLIKAHKACMRSYGFNW